MKTKKFFTTFIVLMVLMITLSACGKKELSPSEARQQFKENSTKTFSQYNSKGRTIWYHSYVSSNKEINEDTGIQQVVVLDKGKLNMYMTSNIDYYYLTFGDLKGLNDNQIIKLVMEKQEEALTRQYELLEEKIDLGKKNDNDKYYPNSKDYISKYKDVVKEYIHKSQQSQKYQLYIDTDSSGYDTKEEMIYFTKPIIENSYISPTTENLKLPQLKEDTGYYTLKSFSGSYSIYDMQFSGYKSKNDYFLTKTNDFTIFELDKPGTAGVEVN